MRLITPQHQLIIKKQNGAQAGRGGGLRVWYNSIHLVFCSTRENRWQINPDYWLDSQSIGRIITMNSGLDCWIDSGWIRCVIKRINSFSILHMGGHGKVAIMDKYPQRSTKRPKPEHRFWGVASTENSFQNTHQWYLYLFLHPQTPLQSIHILKSSFIRIPGPKPSSGNTFGVFPLKMALGRKWAH